MKSLPSLRPLVLAALGLFATAANADIEYRVKPNLAAKTFAIRMTITNAKDKETIRIPAWCPGFYFLLDYNKQLFDFKAVDSDGNDLRAKKIDPRSYEVQNPNGKPVIASYRIVGSDSGLGFFRSHLRQNIGFINGASAFMYADGHMTEPVKASFDLPPDWDIATAMDTDGKGTFTAGGYDEFIDNPIQMGAFTRKKFMVGTVPYEVIWVGDPSIRCNIDEETERLRRGSIPAMKMFGGSSFKKYLYIVHLEVGDFNGGLEHRACNVIAVANSETIHLDDLATHEYFHAWNVKQIRPVLLGPFDYTKEQRCPNIWFSEGVTDYYAQLHAYQAGFFSRSQLLEVLSNKVSELQESKTRLTMTLEDVCKKTWNDPGPNAGFGYGDLSYYTKGLLIGLLSDAYIRSTTHGKSSLDDLMRSFYAKYQLPKPGFEDDAIKQELIAMTDSKGGTYYDQMVRSTGEMPYELLSKMGLRLTIPGQTYVDPLYLLDANGKVTNATISNLQGGIKDGDVVQSAKIVEENKIELHLMRNGQPVTLTVPGRSYKAGDYRLTANPFATDEEKSRLAEWLKIPA